MCVVIKNKNKYLVFGYIIIDIHLNWVLGQSAVLL